MQPTMIPSPPEVPFHAHTVPEELKHLDRWVLWKWEWKERKDGSGSFTKPPRQPNGHLASNIDPNSWSSFPEAYEAFSNDPAWSGLGIVLPPGIVGVDLDDCLDDFGRPDENAELILAKFPTYAEVSPSGTGLKLLMGGQVDPKLLTISHERGVEIYEGGVSPRYFTITGRIIDERHSQIRGQRDELHFLQHVITKPPEPPKEDGTPAQHDQINLAIEYLNGLDKKRKEYYTDWLNVGMSLKAVEDSQRMLDLWVEWSSTSEKFCGAEDCEAKWNSFKRTAGRLCDINTLKKAATDDGYRRKAYSSQAITLTELLKKNIVREYLVEDFLVSKEPMVIGAAMKTLKTTVAVELAVSLALGVKFLGHFEIPKPQSVLFVSGESGELTLQNSFRACVESKNIILEHHPGSTDNIHFSTILPHLDSEEEVDDLLEELLQKGCKVLMVDPLYMSLRVGEVSSNVYSMGERLSLLSRKFSPAGVTVILLHHFRKQGLSFDSPPELEDLSQAGIGEFARQFLLLKRRQAYKHDGLHKLWFHWGGSAGHQGGMILDANTGTMKDGLSWSAKLIEEQVYDNQRDSEKKLEDEALISAASEHILKRMGNLTAMTQSEIVSFMGDHESRIVKQAIAMLCKDNELIKSGNKYQKEG